MAIACSFRLCGSSVRKPARREIKGERLKDQPRGQKPTEIVRERDAEIGAAIMPYPDFGDRRFGPVHDQVPLRHYKCRDDRQGDDVAWPIETPVGTIKQY